jgi:hypothetical protein
LPPDSLRRHSSLKSAPGKWRGPEDGATSLLRVGNVGNHLVDHSVDTGNEGFFDKPAARSSKTHMPSNLLGAMTKSEFIDRTVRGSVDLCSWLKSAAPLTRMATIAIASQIDDLSIDPNHTTVSTGF